MRRRGGDGKSLRCPEREPWTCTCPERPTPFTNHQGGAGGVVARATIAATRALF